MKHSLKILILAATLFSSSAWAIDLPKDFNFSGTIMDTSVAPAAPMTGVHTLTFEIMNPANTCLLFKETQSVTLGSDGSFTHRVGTGTRITAEDGNLAWRTIFQNNFIVRASDPTYCSGGYTPAANDRRNLRVSVGATVLPPFTISSVPTATVAESLNGRTEADFLQPLDDASYDLNQSNLQTVFSSTNYSGLLALLNGTSPLYQKGAPASAVSFNNQRLTNIAAPIATTDAVNKNYSDNKIAGQNLELSALGSGLANGHALIWDQANTRWTTGAPVATDVTKLPLTGGTMTGALNMGSQNISNIGHMTMAAQRVLHLGKYTNAQQSSLLSNLSAPDSGKIWYNSDTASLNFYNGSTHVSLTASGSGGGSGDITDVVAGSGLLGGASIGAASLSVDTGTTANKIVKLDGSGRLPAVDGSLLTNISGGGSDPTKLPLAGGTMSGPISMGAQDISNIGHMALAAQRVLQLGHYTNAQQGTLISNLAAPDKGKIWYNTTNNTLNFFDGTTPQTVATGTSGINALTGDVTASGSGTVATSISAGAITSTKLANDAVISSKVNSTGIAINRLLITDGTTGATVTYATCAVNEILKWTASGWACAADDSGAGGTGDITGVVAGIGLTGGASANEVTLNVDVGTGSNKIVQLDGSGRLPAVDGSQLTNLPGGGGGTINYVVASTGLLGGGTASTVSLAVDIGSGANKIVALDGLARLPAVDGSQLINLSAARLQGIPVSGAGPSFGNILKFNGSLWTPAPLVAADISGGVLSISNGTTGTPSLNFAASSSTGIYSPGTDIMAISTLGSERMRFMPDGRIGIGTLAAPTLGSALDIAGTSTTSSSIIIPRATTAQRPTGVNGMMRYNTSNQKFEAYEGGGWKNMLVQFPLLGSAGSPNAPAYSFASDSFSGMYSPAFANLGFSINNIERMRLDNQGKLGLGTETPFYNLHVVGSGGVGLSVENAYSTGGGQNTLLDLAHSAGIYTSFPVLSFRHNRGSVDTPTPSQAGDVLGETVFQGFNTISHGPGAKISAVATQNFTSTAHGTSINFLTAANGTTTPVPRMIIDQSGNVGIGTTSPSYMLHVNGSAAGTSAWTTISDVRTKRDIANVPDALNNLSKLRGVTYNFRTEDFKNLRLSHREELGVIAQEVEKVYPQAVTNGPDGLKTVAYTMLIAPLIEAVKELRAYLAGHDSRLEQLELENAELKRRLEAIEAKLVK